MNSHEQRREDDFEARLEHAKELLRIEQAVLRAAVEKTPPAQIRITWDDGSRVSRITVWRLRVHLGLVSGRGHNRHRPTRLTGRRDTRAALLEVRP